MRPIERAVQRQTRRTFLGQGLGWLAMSALLRRARAAGEADRWPGVVQPPHVPPRAKRAIHLCMAGGRIAGVVLADGSVIDARSVILTTGTFLRGVIHMGRDRRPGGRVGESPSVRLAERLNALDEG